MVRCALLTSRVGSHSAILPSNGCNGPSQLISARPMEERYFNHTNRPFQQEENMRRIQSVGGVITSGTYWGKKSDIMLRVYT